MSRARNQRGKGKPTDRRMRPPTWRGAMIRGGLFALLLFPISLLFGQAVAGAAVLTVIAALFYIPLGYYTDGFFYRRRMAKAQAQRAAAKEAKRDS